MRPTPRSLILDLLSTLPEGRGSMPVRALVDAGALFDLRENSVRVALARLLARGHVERDERGRYRIGRRAAAVDAEIRSWRRLDERVVGWRGDWIGVHGAAAGGRGARDRSEQALRFLGFRELAPGLAVRPDNLTDGIAGVRRRLDALGLAGGAIVMRLSSLDELTDARARRLWDVEAQDRAYREQRAELDASERRLRGESAARAMTETFLLGGRAIRLLVLDPLLPEEIASVDERRALVARMIEYDAFGRSHWAAFMQSHGLPHRRTPADLRVAEGADRMEQVTAATANGG